MNKARLQELAGIPVTEAKQERTNAGIVYNRLSKMFDECETMLQGLNGGIGQRLKELGYKDTDGTELHGMKQGLKMVLDSMDDMLPGLEMQARGES